MEDPGRVPWRRPSLDRSDEWAALPIASRTAMTTSRLHPFVTIPNCVVSRVHGRSPCGRAQIDFGQQKSKYLHHCNEMSGRGRDTFLTNVKAAGRV